MAMSDVAASQRDLSVSEFRDRLTFDGDGQGYPTTNALVVRDDNEVLLYGSRSRNADGEWELREYLVLGDGVKFHVSDLDRAGLAAVLIETFDPDALTVDDKHRSSTPVKYGVPEPVALDGIPAVAAWLYVRQGRSRSELAEQLDVGERTIREYLSRVRRRGTGLPDDRDPPAVGSIVPEVPRRFDPLGGVDDA